MSVSVCVCVCCVCVMHLNIDSAWLYYKKLSLFIELQVLIQDIFPPKSLFIPSLTLIMIKGFKVDRRGWLVEEQCPTMHLADLFSSP